MQFQQQTITQITIVSYDKDFPTNTSLIDLQKQRLMSHHDRIRTDTFCTILTAIFAIAIFVMATVFFDLQKLQNSTYPVDIDGRLCTLDNPNFNYLYFTSPEDTIKRLCVSKCPNGNQTSLDCWPADEISCRSNTNPQFQVSIYASKESETSMGLFCLPSDSALYKKIVKNSSLQQKFAFIAAYRSILYSALISILIGLFFLLATAFLPSLMTYISIVLGGIACIAVGIYLIVIQSQILDFYNVLRIIVCAAMIIVGLMCLFSLCFNFKDLKNCATYLKRAGDFLKKALVLIFLVLIYYILMIGLFALTIFQFLAFWSHGQLKFVPEDVHKELGGTFSSIMLVICSIQFFWGMSFLKESFDFLISGCSVYFVFKKQFNFSFALGNLFKFHWGSIVAGSFLLNFFYIFDAFYDFFKPNQKSPTLLSRICCCCDRLLGFARSDTLSFVNLVGQPYCNSARYCQEIDQKSTFFQGSQSIFRFFRIGAHILLASLSTIVTYLFMIFSNSEISVLGLMFSFLVNLFVVTFFISMIAQMAQAMLLCTLQNQVNPQQKLIPNRQNQENIAYTF